MPKVNVLKSDDGSEVTLIGDEGSMELQRAIEMYPDHEEVERQRPDLTLLNDQDARSDGRITVVLKKKKVALKAPNKQT